MVASVNDLAGRLAEAEARTRLEKDSAATQVRTVVHIIGGLVEGAPTHPINFLQRLRQLVGVEKSYKVDRAHWLSAFNAATHKADVWMEKHTDVETERDQAIAERDEARSGVYVESLEKACVRHRTEASEAEAERDEAIKAWGMFREMTAEATAQVLDRGAELTEARATIETLRGNMSATETHVGVYGTGVSVEMAWDQDQHTIAQQAETIKALEHHHQIEHLEKEHNADLWEDLTDKIETQAETIEELRKQPEEAKNAHRQ